MNAETAVPVLHPQVVYHLPRELDGEFQAGRVRGGPVRPVSREWEWTRVMTEEVFKQMWRAAGY